MRKRRFPIVAIVSILAILVVGCGSEVTEGELPTAGASGGSETATVPDVVGKSQQEAEETLRLAGFEVEEQRREGAEGESGEVVEQSPSGGGEAEEGVAVVIVVVVQAPAPPESAEEDREPPAEERPSEEEPTAETVSVTVSVPDSPAGLTVTVDGTVAADVFAQPGFSQSFEAQEVLTIVTANAGAVEVEVDGENLGRLGYYGQSVTREITPHP